MENFLLLEQVVHNGPQFIDSRHIEELSGYITLGLEFEMGIFRMKDLRKRDWNLVFSLLGNNILIACLSVSNWPIDTRGSQHKHLYFFIQVKSW